MKKNEDKIIRIIKEHQKRYLSENDSAVLIRSLLNPPKPSNYLMKVAKSYKKDVISK
ncbi:MAG: DUF1778 domain-containing protein [Gammaproteobacteria bacterium]